MSNYTKEYNYVINKNLNNLKIIGNRKISNNNEIIDLSINEVNYLGFKYFNKNIVLVPNNIKFQDDFSSIYYLEKMTNGFSLSIISKINKKIR